MLEEQQHIMRDCAADARSRDGTLKLEPSSIGDEPELNDVERCERWRIDISVHYPSARERRVTH
jgi:hypothetical protein